MTVSTSQFFHLGRSLLSGGDSEGGSLGPIPPCKATSSESQPRRPTEENQDANIGDETSPISPASSKAASGVTTLASTVVDGYVVPMEVDDEPIGVPCGPRMTLSIGGHQEQGSRNYQEDRAAVHYCQAQEECVLYKAGTCSCVVSGLLGAVYDGHSGEDASKYLQAHLGDAVLKAIHHLKQNHGQVWDCKTFGDTIKRCFVEQDSIILAEESIKDGSTATVVVFDDGTLFTANCGDSRAILIRKNSTWCTLTQDHKLDLESERKVVTRIAKERGQDPEPEIVNRRGTWRTLAADRRRGLAVSRSFGDREFKNSNHGLTCFPYCTMSSLSEEHVACVLASDGLWDVVSEEEVAEAVVVARENYPLLTARDLSEELCRMALLRNSQDNITVMVYSTRYTDGYSLKYVYRKVTLKVGNRTINDLHVGLMIDGSDVKEGGQPSAYLGLSSRLTELRAGSRRPSFLQQLAETGAIPHFTVDIRVSRVYHGLTGQLVLGDALPQGEDITLIPLRNDSFLMTRIAVSAVLVRSPTTSGTWIEANNAKEFHHVTIDTGADFTVVPEIVFERIWAAIEDEFGRDRVESYAYIDAYKRILFRKDVITRLPEMVVRVGTESTFDVHLSNHWHICEGTWCKLQVVDRLQQDKPLNKFILGTWFFAEYDVYFDFSRALISLRSPKRYVVRKVTSPEAWNNFRGPLRKRAERERRSGVRGLLRSCTGM
ncbi:hypothetical protein FOZ63_003683 [Perkinsus olseni]|uniref:PPM-type phosphatase domain-containing protein n=1 Tax=Perkinsus olseni TaxID=32597 RepID=A0A7J6SHB2_PEROL|nr:hypothetical protein FOZ63_003683 [Perkinsus olseni]